MKTLEKPEKGDVTIVRVNMMTVKLPDEFSDLQGFVSEWALEYRRDRYKKRYTSSIEDIRIYYDAIMPRMEAIVDHLNQFSVDDIPKASEPLLYMSLSGVEISRAVELWNAPDNYAFPAERVSVDQ